MHDDTLDCDRQLLQTLSQQPFFKTKADQSTDYAQQSLLSFLYLWMGLHKLGRKGFKLTLCSCLPIGGGLGSSASYSTALASSLLLYYGHLPDLSHPESLDKVNQWSLISEKIIHGNPSGIDNTITVYGGAMLYSKFQSKLSPLDSYDFFL